MVYNIYNKQSLLASLKQTWSMEEAIMWLSLLGSTYLNGVFKCTIIWLNLVPENLHFPSRQWRKTSNLGKNNFNSTKKKLKKWLAKTGQKAVKS